MHLHYELSGTGMPIVLSSGIGHTTTVWDELTAPLADHGRVLRWDYRGHGRSERASDPQAYASERGVDDLLQMIAKAGGSAEHPAVLIGHSLGGYLSLCAAIRQPELVRALVLIATGPGFRDAAARERWNQYAMTVKIGPDADPAALRLGVHADGTVIEKLPTLAMPSLVIVGSEDTRFLAAKDYFLAKLPNARGLTIDGGRHSVHRTHAAVVNDAILEFLRAEV